jgi:hypothetical protein
LLPSSPLRDGPKSGPLDPDLYKPGSKERAIADVAGIFKGEIIFGEELMTLDLSREFFQKF